MASRDLGPETVIYEPDWWSRLISIGSLAVAAAACYFAFQVYRDKQFFDRDESARVTAAVEDGIKLIRDEVGTLQEGFDTRLDSAVTQVNRAVDDAFTRNERMVMKPESKPESSLEEPLATPGPVSTEDKTADQAIPLSPGDSAPTLTRSPAKLTLVRATLVPSDLVDRASLSIRNEGESLASITTVRFVPSQVIEGVPKMALPRWGTDEEVGRLAVTFTDEHNDARDSGAAGIYTLVLPQPFRVFAEESVDVHLFLSSEKFEGFGLRGRLEVKYGDAGSRSFDDVLIPFARPTSVSGTEANEPDQGSGSDRALSRPL